MVRIALGIGPATIGTHSSSQSNVRTGYGITEVNTKFDHRLTESRVGDKSGRNPSAGHSAFAGPFQMTYQPNAATVAWRNNLHIYGEIQPPAGWGKARMPGGRVGAENGRNFVDSADSYERSSMGPFGFYFEFPGAGSHPTPEGWVRSLGVGPRALPNAYLPNVRSADVRPSVWADDFFTDPNAGQFLFQSVDVSETV